MMNSQAKAYVEQIERAFLQAADQDIAIGQKAYMRNQFEFYGIKSPVRKELQRPFLLKADLPRHSDSRMIASLAWERPQREWQYFAGELLAKYRQTNAEDLKLYEQLILKKSWWDTVDHIAPNLIGRHLRSRKELQKPLVDKWLASGNIWLQRTAILFQLKYKDDIDMELLDHIIMRLLGSKEFFINKAIGWMLREISKREPDLVIKYVKDTPLSNLSKREALKRIN